MSTPATPVVGLSAQEISQLVQQASQASAAAHKAAQEAQQIAQSIDQNVSALKQTVASSTVEKEVAETGMGERAQIDNAADSAIHRANVKRTADQAQTVDLQTLKVHQDLFNSVYTQSLTNLTQLNGIMAQAMQNAVTQANDAHKQKAEHSDLAHDSFWNPVSAGVGMGITAGGLPANRMVDTMGAVSTGAEATAAAAIAAAVAKSFDATITPVMAVLQQVVALLTAQQAAKA